MGIRKVTYREETYNEEAARKLIENCQVMNLVYKGTSIIDPQSHPFGIDSSQILWNNIQGKSIDYSRYSQVSGKISRGSKVLVSNSKDIIDQINVRIKENIEDILVFDTITPLIDNKEFIDLALNRKIQFISINDYDIAAKFRAALDYLHEKKELRKAGNPNVGLINIEPANELSKKIGPIIDKIHENGLKSFGMKADYLNENGYLTLRDKEWSRASVRNTWLRWKELKAEEENQASASSKGKVPKPE